MLPSHLFPKEQPLDISTIISPNSFFICPIDSSLLSQLQSLLEKDPITQQITFMIINSTTQKQLPDWNQIDVNNTKVLIYWGHIYIPNNYNLCQHLVYSYHNLLSIGYPEELETFNKIDNLYWWPSMQQWVKSYLKGCVKYQKYKINQSGPSMLQPIPGPSSNCLFAHCSMDFIISLPFSKDYDSILSIVDYGMSKGIVLIHYKKTITADGTATLLLNHLYHCFGLPDKTISD